MNTTPNAKRILIYGDSFVYGKIPGGSRFESNERFTGIIQSELGTEYEVIEEGLRGRTVSGENSFFPYRNGLEQFGPIFGSHLPVDLIIFLLGTNDINSGSKKNPDETPNDFIEYLKSIKFWCGSFDYILPQILLIAPPVVEEEFSFNSFKDIFKGAKEKSLSFSKSYKDFSLKNNWHFLDTSNIIKASEIDGVHLDKEGNKILGEAIVKKIKEVLN